MDKESNDLVAVKIVNLAKIKDIKDIEREVCFVNYLIFIDLYFKTIESSKNC